MSLTWANARRTVRKPSVRKATSIEEMREVVCKILDEAEAAFNSGIPHRCIQPNHDDSTLIDVSAFRSTSRIGRDDDGTTAITVKNNKKEVREACQLWREAVRAGDCDKGIMADSQKRKTALRAAWAQKKADRTALVPVRVAVRR